MQNLPDWFPEVWKDEVTVRAQQMKTRVVDTIQDGGMFQGDTCYMPRVGQVEAMDAARLQQFSTTEPPLDWISVTAKPKFLPIKVWDADRNKLTINVTKTLASAVVAGIARARDKLVVDALIDAVTNGVQPVRSRSTEANAIPAVENIVTIGDYNTVIDLDTIAHAYALIGGAEVDVDSEELTFLGSFKNKVNLSLDPLVTSTNTQKKDLPWADFNWRHHEKLPGNGVDGLMGTGVDCFLYAKSCAATAWNDEVTEINERLGAILADMFGQWFQGGACIMETKAIIRIKGKQDFTVTRKAIPVDNIGN